MAATVVCSSSFTLVPFLKRSLIGGEPSSRNDPKPVTGHQIFIDFNGDSSGLSHKF